MYYRASSDLLYMNDVTCRYNVNVASIAFLTYCNAEPVSSSVLFFLQYLFDNLSFISSD